MKLLVDISNSIFADLIKKPNRTEVDNAVLDGILLTKLLDDTQKDILNSDMGESYLRIDGKEYYTDMGYALEGIEMFIEILKERMENKDG